MIEVTEHQEGRPMATEHKTVYANVLVSRHTYETLCSCGTTVTAQNKEDLRKRYAHHVATAGKDS